MSSKESDTEREKRPLPTWEQMTRDTSPEAQAVLLRLQREMPIWRKWELMDDLIRTERMFAWAGLKRRHPEASEAELRRRMADLLLGEELAAKAYGSWEAWEDGDRDEPPRKDSFAGGLGMNSEPGQEHAD